MPRFLSRRDSSSGREAGPGVISVAKAARDVPVPLALMTRFFDKLVRRVVETLERKSHRPGARVHVRVLDADFVMDRVRVDECEALDHVCGVRVEIRRLVEPRPGVL